SIFLVSNIGGMLTPLGDRPLLLGYLRGVPFTWTFRLWAHWALQVAVLLALYFIWDTRQNTREPLAALRRDRAQLEPLRVLGAANIVGLGLVVLAVALLQAPWGEAAIVVLGALSLWRTPPVTPRPNRLTPHPTLQAALL